MHALTHTQTHKHTTTLSLSLSHTHTHTVCWHFLGGDGTLLEEGHGKDCKATAG